ncbi:hypothetical protein Tco_0925375 [Tanacetum coccineum]|uniref:Uncharacterized protein n=1 Tax=Tanacetum coccineum TaxID=301880 RepID=A0ABQ5D6N9_9ASTR
MLMITLIGSSASLGYSIFPEFLKTQSCSEFFPLLLPELQKDGWIDSPQELSKTWDHPHQALISKYCSPSMTAKQLEDIHNFKQEGDESLYQAWEWKWHDGTTSRKMGSSNSIDGLAALVNKLDNLGRHMKKLKESVHAIQAKCKRARGKNKDWWYDYWYEDEEKMELGDEDYNPPIVHTETFEVTKYKFNNRCSFINVSSKNNETLSFGKEKWIKV